MIDGAGEPFEANSKFEVANAKMANAGPFPHFTILISNLERPILNSNPRS
jgi:hypothetical protein